ncbi:MAG TPA: DUF484 family protein [Gammaproteobacteria bacterium]|nr:DUF484 family protein [Gammaproteobacteria bacterium]
MPLEHEHSRALRSRLERLLRDAQHNEAVHRRLQSLELRLIAAQSLGEMLSVLLSEYPRAYRLSHVTLMLASPGPTLRRVIAGEEAGAEWAEQLVFADRLTDVMHLERLGPRPSLGPYDPEHHAPLFPGKSLPPASVALLPMQGHGRLMGLLNLGSPDPGRFRRGAASDFLARFAAVAAMCLENGVNRQLLREVSLTDPLTQVRNRRYFDERLQEELRRASRQQGSLGCLFMDLDHFKHLNDAHGHAAGDRVLAGVARRVQSQLRASDVLARYGGEEFVALLPDADAAHTARVGERIRAAAAAESFASAADGPLYVTLSIGGAAGVPPAAATAGGERLHAWGAALLHTADRALYEAKASGRDRMVLREQPANRVSRARR